MECINWPTDQNKRNSSIMILICGIPNAGKTTFSKRFENVVHYDFVRGSNKTRMNKIVDMLHDDPTICVEGVLGLASFRKRLVDASPIRNTCIWLNTPLDTCVERERTGRQRSENMVRWAYDDFEPPTSDEGWDEIIIITPESKE